MKVSKSVVGLIAVVVSSASFAGGFDGTYIQGELGFSRGKSEVKEASGYFDGNYSQNSTVGQIAIGGSKSYDAFNLAVGAFYVAGTQKSGEKSFTMAGRNVTGKVVQKNTMGLTIEPGYNLNDKALVYAKLGYVKTTASADISVSGLGNVNDSEDYDGVVTGIGAKVRLSEHLYGVAELQQYLYNDAHEVKPSALGIYAGVGTNF